MVLDIDSVKFKPLADGPKGVPSLSRKLHSIYNSWWSTYLHHGDGTSSFDVRPRTSRPGAGTARTSSWTGWDEWVSDRKPAGSHNHVGSGRTYSQYEIKHGVRCRAVGHAMFGVDETTGKPRCTDCGYVSKEDTGLPTPVFPAGVTDLPLPKFGYGLGFGSPADYEEALPTRFCVECGLEEWEPDSEQPCNTSPDGKHVWDEDEGLSEALMGH